MDRPTPCLPWTLLALALCAALAVSPAGTARAEVASEARTPGEIYERKAHVAQCLLYVARDLKARWEKDETQPPAELLLVVDPTTSLKDEIDVLAASLDDAWREGPLGMRIGVYGIQVGAWQAPSRASVDGEANISTIRSIGALSPRRPRAIAARSRTVGDQLRRAPSRASMLSLS